MAPWPYWVNGWCWDETTLSGSVFQIFVAAVTGKTRLPIVDSLKVGSLYNKIVGAAGLSSTARQQHEWVPQDTDRGTAHAEICTYCRSAICCTTIWTGSTLQTPERIDFKLNVTVHRCLQKKAPWSTVAHQDRKSPAIDNYAIATVDSTLAYCAAVPAEHVRAPGRGVRRRTGGRQRRWVVLWSAAAARRALFIGGGGGGVALWSAAAASAASDRTREQWNSALAGQVFFLVLQGSATSLWSLLGRWRRKYNCEYACCAQVHSRNEFLGAHINAMLSVEGTLM